LKGDTAMAKYGEEGRKGVIEIDTKKNYKPLPENRGDSMPPEESRNSEPATRNIVEKIGEKKLETRPLQSPGDSGFRERQKDSCCGLPDHRLVSELRGRCFYS